MYTSYIGLKFLELYNRRMARNYSAAGFFDEVMFPLFFDDPRHLMHVSNSPFFQNPGEKRLRESGLSKPRLQYEDLRMKIREASQNPKIQPDASVYVGYAANGPDQTTAGQVSTLAVPVSAEDLYASWIGNALAARVEGSQCLLLDSEQALWHIYEGWQQYRGYLGPVGGMEGRQIETWNGYWLARGDLTRTPGPSVKGGKLETVSWIEVLARLAGWHPGEALPAYIFSLGQTNKTYGFISLHLPQIHRMSEARRIVKAGLMQGYDDSSFWQVYESAYSLYTACQQGEIGLRALKPSAFAKLMEGEFKSVKLTDKSLDALFHIQVWITAMLNNKIELQELASRLAGALLAAEAGGSGSKRGKTSDSADAKALFESKSVRQFLESLTDFLEKHPEAASVCREAADQSIRIPGEQFPLFKALLRFEYTILQTEKTA